MKIRQYQYGPEKTNSYLIMEDGHGILIDVPSDKIIGEIDKSGINLDYIILTHEHADHLWGLNAVREHYASVVIGQKKCSEYIQDCRKNEARYYHVYYAMKYKDKNIGIFDPFYHCGAADIVFEEEYFLQWRDNSIHIFHTLGHSEGSVMIDVNGNCIFSGDTILKDQGTFTGFDNGSEEEFQKFTKDFIDKINVNMRIYPGHGDSFKFKEWKNGGKTMNRVKYFEVFKALFEVEESELNDSFTFQNVEKWDSLTHLTLITDLEDAFDVMFETDDILHFGGFTNGMKILEKYGVNFTE